MMYKSDMFYLYPPNGDFVYEEGMRYGLTEKAFAGYPIETMLYPCSAQEFTDHLVQKMYPDDDIYYVEVNYVTDDEDTFLANKSQSYLDYMNTENPFAFLYDITCDWVHTSYVEATYYVDNAYEPIYVKLIASTSMIHFIMTDYTIGVTTDMAETRVPYVYCCIATESEAEKGFEDFDMFVANTRVTDEFTIVNMKEAQLLNDIMSNRYPPRYDESELAEELGEGYGTYDIEMFSDYIRDQNDYTTSDGRSFKVPTSIDYVYENDDGSIYVTNGTEQPPGSTRLYAN